MTELAAGEPAMLVTDELRSALETNADLCLVLDAGGRIAHVNGAFQREADAHGPLRSDGGTVLGRPYLDFVSGPPREYLAAQLWHAVGRGGPPATVVFHGECNSSDAVARLRQALFDSRGPR